MSAVNDQATHPKYRHGQPLCVLSGLFELIAVLSFFFPGALAFGAVAFGWYKYFLS